MLREMLQQKQMPIAELARRVGVHESTVRHWRDNGVRVGHVPAVAGALGLRKAEQQRLLSWSVQMDVERVEGRSGGPHQEVRS